jgi:hypothetical protein
MMRRILFSRAAVVSIAVGLTIGCSAGPERLVSDVSKLTTAVAGELRYGDLPDSPTDEQILTGAMQGNDELALAFAGIPVRIRHDQKDAVLLICSPDGKAAWFEDASWTQPVDKQWYSSKPPHPAEFTIALRSEVSSRPAP